MIVLSPHFDDGVLSCWTVLETGGVEVLTVFSGGPSDDRTSEWDAPSGVTSAERMRQRTLENDAALAVAGSTATNVGLLEVQYGGGVVKPEEIASYLANADVVYAPSGVSLDVVHPDHVAVRDAVLALRPDAWLYADNPYCRFEAVDMAVPPGRERVVVDLTAEQRAKKAEAIACYAGEIPKLEPIFGSCTDPDRLRYEVFWRPA